MTLVQPSPEQQAQIRTELNENISTRNQDLEHIKDWLKRQPHLPDFDGKILAQKRYLKHNKYKLVDEVQGAFDGNDDGRIMTFLRGCKFSLEKTKRKLDMYFTMRTAVPEFFSDRDPTKPEIQEIFKIAQVPPLPGLTPNGRRVVVMRGVDASNVIPSVADGMKVVLMIGDIRLKEELVGVAGDVYVLDASIATPQHFASHFSKFTPTLIKKFLICVQEAYPVKLKEVHVINVSPLVDTIINFVKPFLKDKIRSRIHVHENLESLYEYVPKDILPEEYGGGAGPIEAINKQWYAKLVSYQGWFKEQEAVKADELKRPGKPKTHDDLFGMEGSFKQLSID